MIALTRLEFVFVRGAWGGGGHLHCEMATRCLCRWATPKSCTMPCASSRGGWAILPRFPSTRKQRARSSRTPSWGAASLLGWLLPQALPVLALRRECHCLRRLQLRPRAARPVPSALRLPRPPPRRPALRRSIFRSRSRSAASVVGSPSGPGQPPVWPSRRRRQALLPEAAGLQEPYSLWPPERSGQS